MTKIVKAEGSDTETYSELDLTSDLNVSDQIKAKIKRDVGDFLVEQVLLTTQSAKSPVQGEGWPKLSKEYREFKKDEGATPEANMELTGEMMDSLTYHVTEEGIKLGFFDSEAAKADGHNKLSGRENNAPKRRFLPDEGQKFKQEIESEIDKIIADNVADGAIDKKDLSGVETKADLYSVLTKVFDGYSRAEIRATVLRSTDLVDMLDELDLLDLL